MGVPFGGVCYETATDAAWSACQDYKPFTYTTVSGSTYTARVVTCSAVNSAGSSQFNLQLQDCAGATCTARPMVFYTPGGTCSQMTYVSAQTRGITPQDHIQLSWAVVLCWVVVWGMGRLGRRAL